MPGRVMLQMSKLLFALALIALVTGLVSGHDRNGEITALALALAACGSFLVSSYQRAPVTSGISLIGSFLICAAVLLGVMLGLITGPFPAAPIGLRLFIVGVIAWIVGNVLQRRNVQ